MYTETWILRVHIKIYYFAKYIIEVENSNKVLSNQYLSISVNFKRQQSAYKVSEAVQLYTAMMDLKAPWVSTQAVFLLVWTLSTTKWTGSWCARKWAGSSCARKCALSRSISASTSLHKHITSIQSAHKQCAPTYIAHFKSIRATVQAASFCSKWVVSTICSIPYILISFLHDAALWQISLLSHQLPFTQFCALHTLCHIASPHCATLCHCPQKKVSIPFVLAALCSLCLCGPLWQCRPRPAPV